MGTPLTKVYEAFLAKIEQNEWTTVEEMQAAEKDWFKLLEMAINRFMFPRISLDINPIEDPTNGFSFIATITTAEIQVLATFMKNEWLKRSLASWELIRQQYTTKDFQFFSPANQMGKIQEAINQSNDECLRILNVYGRAINGKPFNWSGLAGS